MNILCKSLFFFLLSLSLFANTKVRFETTKGVIDLELFDKSAPKTVANFLSYVKKGHYNNTIFHRVIDNFMIQGGGYSPDLKKKKALKTVENEAFNKIENSKGTVAMARTSDPHSASAQFFINVKDNQFLNFQSKTSSRSWGYAVFGRIVKGMTVVNQIKKVAVKPNGPFQNLPIENIIIKSAKVIK